MYRVLSWITIGWAALLLSSMVSMMAVFLGSASLDLYGLLQVQAALVPLALLAITGYVLHARYRSENATALATLWRHIPGWLVFVVVCAALLTLIAELTFLLIGLLAEEPRPLLEHVPAVSAIVNAIALAAGYASLQMSVGR